MVNGACVIARKNSRRCAPRRPLLWQKHCSAIFVAANCIEDALAKLVGKKGTVRRPVASLAGTPLAILSFQRIRETAFCSWADNTIPRRFCSAVVEVSERRKHAIHYSIAEDTGMIGARWGVEWCVVGLDRSFQVTLALGNIPHGQYRGASAAAD